jgi:hypothetical protein
MRIFILYKPLRFFAAVGTLFLLPGIALGVRFVLRYLEGNGSGHTQSLILAAVLLLTAVIIYAAGLLSDLIAANRTMLEELRMRMLRTDLESRGDRERYGHDHSTSPGCVDDLITQARRAESQRAER